MAASARAASTTLKPDEALDHREPPGVGYRHAALVHARVVVIGYGVESSAIGELLGALTWLALGGGIGGGRDSSSVSERGSALRFRALLTEGVPEVGTWLFPSGRDTSNKQPQR